MPTNLTGSTVAATYDQLLHIDGGPTAAEATVYSGAGVATALLVGTTAIGAGNLSLGGNTISSTDTNGDIALAPNGSGAVQIGNVDITGGSVTGITDLAIADGGTGASTAPNARTNLGLGTIATQNANNVSISGGAISGVAFSGSFTGVTLIESTSFATDNLSAGCNLTNTTLAADGTDADIGITITPKGTGSVQIAGVAIAGGAVDATTLATNTVAAGVNLSGTTLAADGTDTNIDVNITPKGTGEVNITNVDILSGKVPFSTITGRAFAAFSDVTDQTGSASAVTFVQFGTTEVAGSGITMVTDGSALTRLTFAAAGTYMVAPNLQFANSDTVDHDVIVWFAINGANVDRSATRITVPKAGDGGSAFFQIVFYVVVTAGQYVQVAWLPENATVTLAHTAADAGPPAIPATPSAIVSAERIA